MFDTVRSVIDGLSGTVDEDGAQEVPDVLERTGFDGSVEGAEVIGRSPMSYIAAGESVSSLMGRQTARKLADYGIDDPRPEEWYPLAGSLAMLFELREEYGADSVQMMGRHVPEHVEFPPGLDGVEAALSAIDGAYHQNHRGGDLGGYEFHPDGAAEGTVVCENPYPCELDQGLIKGVAQQFADSSVSVEEVGDGCRSDGDGRCEYRVTWVAGR